MVRIAIANVNLEIEIPEDKSVEEVLMEADMPDNYVPESMELVKIIDEY